ncbi:MAG: hypothetical protein ABI539_07235, partial [Acidobacteriota bacterium]
MRYRGPAKHGRRFLWGALVILTICGFLSCGSPPADLRTLVPGDALVFLETNDLGRTIAAITGNAKFAELAKNKPNVSALNGIKVAIAVTGFETSEQPLTDEDSVLNFQPHFVAVAETNAWSWQTASFAEDQLGEFVNEIYGGEVELESVPKYDGKLYAWKAVDGRMAYAYLEGSLVFFGNDLTAIEKCLSVKRGETESIAKNQKIKPASDSIGYGYISTDGVAQLANIAGVTLAMKAGEEADVKSFMSRVIPEILRGSVTDVAWTATSTADGRIEDRYLIGLETETLKIFAETLGPSGNTDPDLSRFVPKEFATTTLYNFADPRIAWRSVVLTAQKRTDQVSGSLLNAFSGSLFEPYGIDDPEIFLSAAGQVIQTVAIDDDADNVAVIASFKDFEKIKKGIAKEVNFAKPPEKIENADVWRSDDN